jgi:hypothetical protein
MFYQVGDQRFTNKFLAAQYAVDQRSKLHFNMYDLAFDLCDWTREPDLSWDQLLDIRAHQIAAKNKPIVLNFSGGTDSYTMYRVFERNRIHIDILYVRLHAGQSEDKRFREVYDFLNQGLYDPLTKIVLDRDSVNSFRRSYFSPYWIFETGIRFQWGIRSGDTASEQYLAELLDTTDFVSVIGLEKPRLKFQDGQVYSYQDDENYGRIMANPTLDCFFISPDLPELHVKQSYMLLNYIRSLVPQATSAADLESFNNVHSAYHHDWLDYSIRGCGRFGDINQSSKQHIGNHGLKLILPTNNQGTLYSGRNRDWWTTLSGDIAQKNYLEGIMMVAQSDAGRLLLQNPKNFYWVRQFQSKPYALIF